MACAVTLAAGVFLEESGNVLANRAGINGVVFGEPLARVGNGAARDQFRHHGRAPRRQRACDGDIFGGNAFQVCLFLVADLVAR